MSRRIHKLDSDIRIIKPGSMFLLKHKITILNILCIYVANSHNLTKIVMSLSDCENVMVLKTIAMELSRFIEDIFKTA